MSPSDADRPPRYVIVEGDFFESDLDGAILSANMILGPDRAEEWRQGLMRALRNLLGFPGPLSHARDEEASAFFGREVRRLLYHGPGRRRSKQPTRILFTLTPPADDDPEGETVIYLLRLLRGNQSLTDPDEPTP